MSISKVLLLTSAACMLIAALLGGSAPFGRVLMAIGLPSVAAHFLNEPEWRGTAYALSNQPNKAAAAFEDAGTLWAYNTGTEFAKAGKYAHALETLDRHLLIFPDDVQAQDNYDLVRLYYAGIVIDPDSEIITPPKRESGPTAEAEIGRGNARAAGTGSESTNDGATLGLPTLLGRGRLGVRKVFDDYYYEANRKWLKSMPDLPGEYLAARIKHEHKRREELGIGQPPSESPW